MTPEERAEEIFASPDEDVAWIAEQIRAAIAEEREACIKISEHFLGSLWGVEVNHVAAIIISEIRKRGE